MDFLDSILNGMDKPPAVKKPEIKDKEKREKFEKMQKARQEAARKQKELVNKFRADIAKRIRDFVNTPTTSDPSTVKLELKPMSKLYRTIVREICDEHDEDVVVHSFGDEEVDRHCIIWRKGYEPCEEEIRAMKFGLEYKPKNDEADDKGDQECDDDDDTAGGSKTKDGKDKFWSKYEKIIGENASGLESARIAEPAKQYGCVPIDKKKDQRSIEQMMDDIRRKKTEDRRSSGKQ
uniref:Sperm-associated antigen 7 n=1 Tax=Aceria tosichella TaxID=561515 RepID=A0A6G1SIT8_9ACAR